MDKKTVYLVEDDVPLSNSIIGFLSPLGFRCLSFRSGEELLTWLALQPQAIQSPACLLCDMRLLGMSGFELFSLLKKNALPMSWEIIFITGHGEVSMAVESMQQGAFDFVSKPFDPFLLSQKITSAIELSHKKSLNLYFKKDYSSKINTLTPQESNVMGLLLSDMTNKEIAEYLEVSVRTVEIHRANLFRKMKVESAIELSQLNERFQLLQQYTLIRN